MNDAVQRAVAMLRRYAESERALQVRAVAWRWRDEIALVGTWLTLVVVALNTRPLLPIDETRYLSVAWEMWIRDSYLVPLLNGEPYSHKPPLLFWAIHAGWSVFGVQEWWGRMVAPLFGLASLFAARGLARALWPDAPHRAQLVPWILIGCLAWAVFTTVTMFDLLMVLFTVLAMLGLVHVWRGRQWRGWAIVAASIGLGALAKGPVIAVYVLPAVVLAPLWMKPRQVSWIAYAIGAVIAIAAGAFIGIAWALPAAEVGGYNYGRAILWGQTAGRIAEAFAHQRPWWWYLPVLPALLFPWIAWPAAWRALPTALRSTDGGIRLALAWLVASFVVLSLISGKQPHYLLPLLPAVALLLAVGLERVPLGRWNAVLPGFAVVLLGAALAGFSYWLRNEPDAFTVTGLPAYAANISPLFGVAVAAVGAVVVWQGRRRAPLAVGGLALQSAAVVMLFHVLAFTEVAHAFDLRPIARYVASAQRSGRPIAIMAEYHGQFTFLGRMQRPLRVQPVDGALNWLQADFRRVIVMTMPDIPDRWMLTEYSQPYRGRTLAIVNKDTYDAYLTLQRMQENGVTIVRERDRRAPDANARRPGQHD
jgi:4-amino-4-deoxy-L-arabinose transferase-like glycosyltransferase